jgi:hypothetical protein
VPGSTDEDLAGERRHGEAEVVAAMRVPAGQLTSCLPAMARGHEHVGPSATAHVPRVRDRHGPVVGSDRETETSVGLGVARMERRSLSNCASARIY